MSETPDTVLIMQHDVDLWRLATYLTETPLDRIARPRARQREGEETDRNGAATTRDGRRAARARRPWILLGGGVAAVLAVVAGVCAFTVDGGWRAVAAACTGMLIVVAGTTLSFGIGMEAFRRASRAIVVFTRAVWGVSLAAAFLFGILGVAAAVVSDAAGVIASDADTARELADDYRVLALMLAVLTPMLAIMCSSAAQPLVSTSRPRLWQQHGAVLCWTASLTMLVITVCLLLVPLAPLLQAWTSTFDAAGLFIGIALALVTAVFAWHVRSRERLARERRDLLTLFDDAARACRVPSDAEPALVRLQEAVTVDPFRSQSPAALPTTAGSEIAQTVAALLAAVRREPFPPAWAGRTSLPGDVGRRFLAARELFENDPAAFVSAGTTVLRRCHDELLTGRPITTGVPSASR